MPDYDDNDDMIVELEDGRAVIVAPAGQQVTDDALDRLGVKREEVKRRGDTGLAIPSGEAPASTGEAADPAARTAKRTGPNT